MFGNMKETRFIAEFTENKSKGIATHCTKETDYTQLEQETFKHVHLNKAKHYSKDPHKGMNLMPHLKRKQEKISNSGGGNKTMMAKAENSKQKEDKYSQS